MGNVPTPLATLLLTWVLVTAVLVIVVVYRATLSSREDDQIFLNKAEDEMMASEQREIISRIDGLTRSIVALAALSGVLFLSSFGVWIWGGFNSF